MDNYTDAADNCQPKTSNSNANVRTKVSSWVTNFVSEMRTKSPAVVQRWVDSIPNENTTILASEDCLNCEQLSETTIECTTFEEEQEQEHKDKVKEIFPLESITEDKPNTEHQPNESINTENRFWRRGPLILLALRRRSSLGQCSVTDDLTTSATSSIDEPITTSDNSTATLLNKSKLNELYDKLSINRKRYNFLKERKMEARKMLNNAKSRFLATTVDQTNVDIDTCSDSVQNIKINEIDDNNIIVVPETPTTTTMETITESNRSHAFDPIEMDISTDEFSRLSQSNDMLSVDDDDEDDSFNISMPSITDGPSTTHQHLNVNRKIAMADIGRSTSDNPRLRNKFYLADIGRSFSEHQDDEAIIIGERNISAPTSSIAIQNNNKTNGNFYERRAYSVSPTQRHLKRGVLSRDHSLSDSSRHRHQLSKGNSFQSDSSHCSSVESLLDARKPDSEAILRHLGFGPAHQEDLLSRIPKRFLKPSQVPGIDTETFMKQQQIANNLHEQSILGYRGLVGNPHVLPSVIVAKIMERFQLSDEKNTKLFDSFNNERPMSAPPTPGLSDLSNLSNLPHTEP